MIFYDYDDDDDDERDRPELIVIPYWSNCLDPICPLGQLLKTEHCSDQSDPDWKLIAAKCKHSCAPLQTPPSTIAGDKDFLPQISSL